MLPIFDHRRWSWWRRYQYFTLFLITTGSQVYGEHTRNVWKFIQCPEHVLKCVWTKPLGCVSCISWLFSDDLSAIWVVPEIALCMRKRNVKKVCITGKICFCNRRKDGEDILMICLLWHRRASARLFVDWKIQSWTVFAFNLCAVFAASLFIIMTWN